MHALLFTGLHDVNSFALAWLMACAGSAERGDRMLWRIWYVQHSVSAHAVMCSALCKPTSLVQFHYVLVQYLLQCPVPMPRAPISERPACRLAPTHVLAPLHGHGQSLYACEPVHVMRTHTRAAFGYHLGVVNGPLEVIARDLGFLGDKALEGAVCALDMFSLPVMIHALSSFV